ncbi:hypothetical protein O0L34_g17990 [Tuta absoluta]|nr:hypothetical protein O0L34_g17990 [Tuta absoluta]
MSSQWVNKFAIMRDLSLAQGCLPVDVVGAFGAGERPPTSLFKEDTEEDFYRQWVVGDGDFAAPDLGLIQDMLEMVKNQESPNENVNSEDVIQIQKLNPMVSEFIPNPKKSQTDPKKLKQKKERNAAVQSLLQNINLGTTKNKETNQLLKPQNFTARADKKLNEKTTLEDKVTIKPTDSKAARTIAPQFHENEVRWLQTPAPKTPSPTKKNGPMLNWNPTSMFRKKHTLEDSVTKPVQEVKKVSPNSYNKYVPSKTAEEYYKKFLQSSEMHRMVAESVWTKVERQMKEIDERRKAEAELLALSRALCDDKPDADSTRDKDTLQQKLAFVRLSQHRHLLPRPCAVCAYKHNRDKQHNDANNNTSRLKENVVDPWWKQHHHASNTTVNKENVDDPWWNWRDDQQEKVDDNWRKTTALTDDKNYKDKQLIDENKTPVNKENVDDPWWNWCDYQQEKVDDNWRNVTALTEDINHRDKHFIEENNTLVNKESVDDPWWDCRDDQTENVDDNWRTKTPLTEDINPRDKQVIDKNTTLVNKEYVDDHWWDCRDDEQEKVDDNKRNEAALTTDKNHRDKQLIDENNTPVINENVDDLWWNWCDDQKENVDDIWRNETVLTEDKNLVEAQSWRPGRDPWWTWIDDIKEENENELIESSSSHIVITKVINDSNLEPNNDRTELCNENFISKMADGEIFKEANALSSKYGDLESQLKEKLGIVNEFASSIKYEDVVPPKESISSTANKSQETVRLNDDEECWATTLDDCDDIDAWRSEILDIDDDDDDDDKRTRTDLVTMKRMLRVCAERE